MTKYIFSTQAAFETPYLGSNSAIPAVLPNYSHCLHASLALGAQDSLSKLAQHKYSIRKVVRLLKQF